VSCAQPSDASSDRRTNRSGVLYKVASRRTKKPSWIANLEVGHYRSPLPSAPRANGKRLF
jgi:hypothetical protein